MVHSEVPSDVIVDASMAAAVRDAGRMWTKERLGRPNREVDVFFLCLVDV